MAPMILGAAPGSDGKRQRWLGLSAVIGVHLVVLHFILQQTPAVEVLRHATPLMVSLITPAPIVAPPPPAPPRQPPKPVLAPPKATTTPPVATPAPVPLTDSVPAPSPLPAIEAAPASIATAPPAAATAPTGPAVAEPAPVMPPSFAAAYLRNQAPAYPPASRRAAEEGRVVLRVLVNAGGDPERIEVATSSGFERLDAAALTAVRTWKFVPAQQAGRNVAAWVQVPLVFTLTR